MSSFVYYKFKSQKDESRIAFDGTGISIFDLKREIILAKGLEKATDVDIVLLDPKTDEEYEDSRIIPRSSTVIVKRTPVRPGKSKIAKYFTSTNASAPARDSTRPTAPSASYIGPMTKRFDGKEEPAESRLPSIPNSSIKDDEAAAMEAMFAAEEENWTATQQKMSQQQRIYSAPRYNNKKFVANGAPQHSGTSYSSAQNHGARYQPYPERPIPQGYVCFRCGQKGHWIQDCPTNKDREWDNKPRLKRTTGIPRSFLKTVEQSGEAPVGAGVMITPEGKLVVAQPDSASWEKHAPRHKGLTEADIRERPVTDPTLACPIDSVLFRDAVKTPCCNSSYCEECIQTYLLENDFLCPKCRAKIASLDRLVIDKPTRTRVLDYIDKACLEGTVDFDQPDEELQGPGEDLSNDQDILFGQQPGGPTSLALGQTGYQESRTMEQIQAEIQQLQTMLNNPKLPYHSRSQAMMQLSQKQTLLKQAQTMSMLISQAQAAAVAESAMISNAMFNAPQMAYNYMPTPYNMPGDWGQAPQQQARTTHSDQDSAYQRLPVNGRRRAPRRDRPSDFVEVGSQSYPL